MSGLSLLAPAGLFALIALPLIVLFHLRQRIQEERQIPSLRFWRAATTETIRSDGFRRPPITLPFILRLMIAAFLALALARPAATSSFLGLSARGEAVHLVLMIDGSTSMAALDGSQGSSRFDAARDQALLEIDRLGPGDVASVMVLGSHLSTLQGSDPPSIGSLRSTVADMRLPGGRADLDSALRLVEHLTIPGLRTEIVLFTDGGITADPVLAGRLPAPVRVQRVGTESTPNLAVTEIALRSGGTTSGSRVYARVTNFSDTPVQTTITVSADGIAVMSEDHTIPANGDVEVISAIPDQTTIASVTLPNQDAHPIDDRADIPLGSSSAAGVRILMVSDFPSALQRALSVVPGVVLDVIASSEAVGSSVFAGYDLIVFEGTNPVGGVPNRPLVLVNPPPDGIAVVSGSITAPVITSIKARDPLLNGVDLGGTAFGQTALLSVDASADVIVAAAEGPLIYRSSVPSTNQPMVVLAFDVAASNLPSRVAFPILISNIVNELVPSSAQVVGRFGETVDYTVKPETYDLKVLAETEIIYDHFITYRPTGAPFDLTLPITLDRTGIIMISEFDATGQQLSSSSLAVNAGDARESDLRADDGLLSTFGNGSLTAEQSSRTTSANLWPLLVGSVLLLLGIESLAVWAAARRRSARR